MKAFNYSAISISLVLCALMSAPQSASAQVGLDLGTFQTISAGHATASSSRQLSPSDREELATHAAFAETAAARTNGSGRVIAARKRARSSVSCGSGAKDRAQAGLSAGRKFEQKFVDRRAQLSRAKSRKAKRRQERKVRRANRKQRARTLAARRRALAPTQRTSLRVAERRSRGKVARGSIARFKSQTRAYYIQRRCNHLSYNKALRFWELIAVQHDRMIRRYGSGAVSRAQRQARSAARRARCSAATKQQVSAGLRGVRRDVRVN